jgi:uncharacterized membrane protein YhaH (DUF805 family)
LKNLSNRKVNFIQSISLFYSNYLNFGGRSSRGAYWWWVLAYIVIFYPLVFIEMILYMEGTIGSGSMISSLFLLINIIPTFALLTRRLHDVGRSGWWQLIQFTIIGTIPLFYWMCKKGDLGTNKYGEDIEAGR